MEETFPLRSYMSIYANLDHWYEPRNHNNTALTEKLWETETISSPLNLGFRSFVMLQSRDSRTQSLSDKRKGTKTVTGERKKTTKD